MKYKLLDCTLRDGGYYNNWDFSLKLAQDYLNAISKSGICYVELGFRSLKKQNYKGPNWYTTDEYINNLTIPKNLNLGVMVNVFEITSSPLNLTKTLNLLFKKKKDSKIKFIRLASHFHEINKAFEICKILKAKGYIVGINLMQISEQTEKEIKMVAKFANKFKPHMLYFADSLGGMDEKKIFDVIRNLRTYWKGELGIHTHDNLGQALSNSIFAIKNNINWIDSTVAGMGRGPGNAKTELMLLEIEKFQKTNVNIIPILNLIKKYFDKLKSTYNWGTNPFYHLAGKFGIHPTYIQEMISQKLDNIQILEAIDQLKDGKGSKYDVNLVRSEFQKPIKLVRGKWCPLKKFRKKEVLFISNGPNINHNKKEIEKYIKTKKPIVISLKPKVNIQKKLISYYVACNPLRIMGDVDLYKNINKPLIIPFSLLTDKLKIKFSKIKLLDFGIGLKNNKFEFYSNCALIPKLYTIAYALSLVTSGKVSNILLAGFDGYGENDRRTKLVDEIFTNYSSHKKAIKIYSITPTTYSFSKKSIYAI